MYCPSHLRSNLILEDKKKMLKDRSKIYSSRIGPVNFIILLYKFPSFYHI